MRKQGLDAHLGFRRKEIEFVFAVLLSNRVVGLDFHHSEWVTRLLDPVANYEIVTEVDEEQYEDCDREDALHRHTFLSFPVVVVGRWSMAQFGMSWINHASTMGEYLTDDRSGPINQPC